MFTPAPIGGTRADLDEATRRVMELLPPPAPMSLEEFRAGLKSRGAIGGGSEEIVDRLGQLADSGVDEVIFVDAPGVMDFLEADVVPKVAKLRRQAAATAV